MAKPGGEWWDLNPRILAYQRFASSETRVAERSPVLRIDARAGGPDPGYIARRRPLSRPRNGTGLGTSSSPGSMSRCSRRLAGSATVSPIVGSWTPRPVTCRDAAPSWTSWCSRSTSRTRCRAARGCKETCVLLGPRDSPDTRTGDDVRRGCRRPPCPAAPPSGADAGPPEARRLAARLAFASGDWTASSLQSRGPAE